MFWLVFLYGYIPYFNNINNQIIGNTIFENNFFDNNKIVNSNNNKANKTVENLFKSKNINFSKAFFT